MSWGDLVSGIIGAVHNRSDTLSGRKENELNREAQGDFAQQGIQWRVKDAKAAGIHPLFALNANLPSYSPTIPIQSDTGFAKDIGAAVDGFTKDTSGEDEMRKAQLAVLHSEANRNDAVAEQARMSNLARASQGSNTSQDGGMGPLSLRNDAKMNTLGFDTPLTFPKERTPAETLENLFGDAAAEIEALPLYVKQKGVQIAEEYRDFLNGIFGSADFFSGNPTRFARSLKSFKPPRR